MKWPWQWRWRRNGAADAARARAEAEARLRAAKRATPHVERAADQLGRLPADEFADRVSRAFRRPA